MKRFKIVFSALLAVAILGGVFAFTTNNTKAIDTWFRFDGDPTNKASILTPSLYVQISTPANSSPDNLLQAIKVQASTEKYANGTPKVDVVSSSLQNAILLATDIDNGRANPFEIANRVQMKP